jgi:hypothetical protein
MAGSSAGLTRLGQTVPDEQALVKEIMGTLEPVELQTLFQFLDRLDEATSE